MIDWQQQITSRVNHAHYVTAQALQIAAEHPTASIACRHRLACAVQDLADAATLVSVDDRGLEYAEDILHRARQADARRVIGAADHRLSRALAAVDWVRKAIKGG